MKKIFPKIFLILSLALLFTGSSAPPVFAAEIVCGEFGPDGRSYFFTFTPADGEDATTRTRCFSTPDDCAIARNAYRNNHESHSHDHNIIPIRGACPSSFGVPPPAPPPSPTPSPTPPAPGTCGDDTPDVCVPNCAPADPDCSTTLPPGLCDATTVPDGQCNTPVPPCLPDVDCGSCGGGNACIQNCPLPGDPDCAPPSAPIEKLLNPTPGIIDWYGFVRALLSIIVRVMLPIAALLIVYSGFLFLTAQGDEAKLKKAKGAFVWAVIGTSVLLGAWALAEAIEGTVSTIQAAP